MNTGGSSGFTLIEVLIVMTIMAFISMQIFMALRNSFHRRQSFLDRSDFHNGITLAIGILERDFKLLHSPVIMVPDWRQPTEDDEADDFAAGLSPHEQAVPSEFWGDLIDETGTRHSRLIGETSSLDFISASHIKIYDESPESVFAKVSFEIHHDPFPKEGMEGTFVLIKRLNTDVFNMEEDDNEFSQTYPLLQGVTGFQIQYYDRETDTWHSRWDSNSAELKNKYPDAIEVHLTAQGGENLEFEGAFLIRPEIPIHGYATTF